MNIIFVMIRHVTKNMLDSDKIWKESYTCIRKFYNNKIIIIDNNSDYNLIQNDITLENCDIIQCKYYNSRLFSPFYELLKIDFDRAIIIHDGVIFQKFVDFNLFDKVKFIWHFDIKQYDNINLIEKQLNLLTNNDILFDTFKNKKFTGCMGCCMAITKNFLNTLENTFNLSNLKDYIQNQDDAIAFERTISIACFGINQNLINDISFENEIKYMAWGYNYKHYINKQIFFDSIEWDTKKKVIIDISNKSIVKIFGARK